MKYLVANWKSNKTTAEVREWVEATKAKMEKGATGSATVVLCPSFVHFSLLQWLLPTVALGSQTLSPFPNGAYTGAVSAQQMKEFAKFCILGHAERRKYFHETIQEIANQAAQALELKITPIIAVDQYNWRAQLAALEDGLIKKVLVMFEPPEAISTTGNGAADLDDVIKAAKEISKTYPVMGVLYGGSVNSENVSAYWNVSELSGVVVGSASLDATEWLKIVRAVG